MAEGVWSRRDLLRRMLGAAGGGLLLSWMMGCGRDGSGDAPAGLSCTDSSGLTTSQRNLRESLGYVDASPHGKEKSCSRCQFFSSAGDDACGNCVVVAGPISPMGYCSAWGPHPS